MLPPIFFEPLFNFFNAIDRILSSDVGRNPDTSETTITNQLLWFMNSKAAPRDDFAPSVEAFKNAMHLALGDEPKLGIRFQTEGYSQNFEGDVSQADYALNISFKDTSAANDGIENNWHATYLIQSKVARRRDEDAGWDQYDTFSRDTQQSNAIERMRELIGDDGLRYHLYCPPNALHYVPKAAIPIKLAAADPSSLIVRHYHNAGFWLKNSFPASINALFTDSASDPTPWALFILAHFYNIKSPDGLDIKTEKLYAGVPGELLEMRQNIFNRKHDAIERAIQLKELQTGRKIVRREKYFEVGRRRTISIGLEFPTLDHEMRVDRSDKNGDDNDTGGSVGLTPAGI